MFVLTQAKTRSTNEKKKNKIDKNWHLMLHRTAIAFYSRTIFVPICFIFRFSFQESESVSTLCGVILYCGRVQ
jgi:hypothetical protein